ncbi:2-oxoglutarate/Fe(II)-dependent dioxygenase [Acrasis kona]|uniref:2-oxoglutarate/Fe(II)-dependent dioxygenase n=1 Tax=Acrasis kona TaxID=1008807 RepID=A0AAW2YZA2_9EUKA
MSFPVFPEGVPIAPISSIKYSELNKSAKEVLECCSTVGFFYLDLSGHSITSKADEIREIAVSSFRLPAEEKMKYHLQKGVSLAGYKAPGTVKKTDETHRPDTTEFFNVFTDHITGTTDSIQYPPHLIEHKALLKQFSQDAHAIGNEILSVLADQLSIPSSEFTSRNSFSTSSQSHIRLTHKIPHEGADAVGLPSHTDFGSVTVLFTWLGGLQIQHQGEWKYVKPLKNHAIINLGDAIVHLTNGALLSAKHRVVDAPKEQNKLDRYSVVYFVRPNNQVEMKPLERFLNDDTPRKRVGGKFEQEEGVVLSAEEWIRRRAAQLGS